MQNRLWFAAVIAATPILALSPVAFPASHQPGCVRATPGVRYNLRLFHSLMRRRDTTSAKTLSVYNVERVKPHQVMPITDPAVCERAAVAYGRAFNEASLDRKVHILRVGNRYIVMDPEYRPDDYHRAVTFDSSFTQPLAFVAE